jgi:flagellar basal-body rod modification protein FlgD
MKLLTAQLKNQSPLDPVDPMQFTSQLVQFNMLDQLTQIRGLLQQSLSPTSTGKANR